MAGGGGPWPPPLAAGWSRRRQASREQVIHAAKRSEPFDVINLSVVREELPDGCDFATENTVGELQISTLFLDTAPEAPSAAWEGWNGDRYIVAVPEPARPPPGLPGFGEQ